jgi:diazepam-binding inhibitor (GABA receptor modulator, acyl-CoA-binding protein)
MVVTAFVHPGTISDLPDLASGAPGGKHIMSDLKTQFDQAVATSKSLTAKPDNATLLTIYALYKQATAGDIKGERPSSADFVAAAKFDAWEELSGTSKDEAMATYATLIAKLKG